MSDHNMTVEWDGVRHYPSYHLGCTAPPEALCRAQWPCECEYIGAAGVDDDGRPWHEPLRDWMTSDELDTEQDGGGRPRHYGQPGGDCTVALYANDADCNDELGRGSITFPVDTQWDDDNYVWTVAQR